MSNRTRQPANEQRTSEKLCDAIVKRMEARFKGDGKGDRHDPSPDHWRGLREIAQTIAAMALGLAAEKFYYSSLPTGMGKTSCCIAAVNEFCANHPDVGVLMLVNELRQIDTLIAEMGLREDQYAIHVGKANVEMNARGVCSGLNPKQWPAARRTAQVLFITQQKLFHLPRVNRNFGKLFPYHVGESVYPRRVRLWDEAIVPAEALVITLPDIAEFTGKLFARGHDAAAIVLRDWMGEIKDDRSTVTEVPTFNLELNWSDENFDDDLMTDDQGRATPASVLNGLQGQAVRVHRDEYNGTVMLSYRDYLPKDCAPMVILDASGDLRQVYKLWMKGRGDMVQLDSPKKSYRNLTIHHWNRASGKAAYRNPATLDELSSGVLDALKQTPAGEHLLVFYHKEGVTTDSKSGDPKDCQDLKQCVDGKVLEWGGTAALARLEFVGYGRHLASNDHRDIRNVCVVGLLQYNLPQNEAMYRAALGASADQDISPAELHDFRIGEVKHHLFQAVGRGAVRKARGDSCPEGCHLWLIHSTFRSNLYHTPIERLLECFPDAKLVPWEPLGVSLKGGNLKSRARIKIFEKLLEQGEREFWAEALVDEGAGLKYQTVAKALAHIVTGNPKQRELKRALAARGLVLRSRKASNGKTQAARYWLEGLEGG